MHHVWGIQISNKDFPTTTRKKYWPRWN
jgi:hypothetical protein